MNYSSKYRMGILEQNGFVFRRSNGSHHIYFNQEKRKIVVVPVHGSKNLPKGTFFAILKQAGLDKTDLE
jgi:predicted RNA binding protein YcfA (HicA-like mRNA interferase family)